MSFPVRVCIKNLIYNQTQIAGPEREEPGTEEEEDNTNYNWTYLTSDKVIHNSTKNREYTYTVNDATHDLEVKFTKPSQGFFLSDGGETGTTTSSGG